MLKQNQEGQVLLFFILLIPILLLFLLATVEFSKQVYFKIRMQETLNRAVYAGAGSLTESLNQIALLNRRVHRLFLDRKKDFQQRGMKKNPEEAKRQLRETMRRQERLLEKMEQQGSRAYRKAYQITNAVVQEEFPGTAIEPLYQAPILLEEGLYEEISFAHVKGKTFDPKGYKKIPKAGNYLRMAFRKAPSGKAAMAALLTLPPPDTLLSFLKGRQDLRAVAAAQPFGGSLWLDALVHPKGEGRLYQTTMIPEGHLYAK